MSGASLSKPSLRLVSDTRWETPLAALMMIDLNGPDIEAVDEVKALILESVNAWKNNTMRMPARSSAGVTRPSRSALSRSVTVRKGLAHLDTPAGSNVWPISRTVASLRHEVRVYVRPTALFFKIN